MFHHHHTRRAELHVQHDPLGGCQHDRLDEFVVLVRPLSPPTSFILA